MKKDVIKFIKFGFVGILNTTITFVVYTLLVKLGVYYVIANVIGFCAGAANSYAINSRWVFASRKDIAEAARFFTISGVCLAISSALIYFFVDVANFQKIVAQVFVIPVVMIINFVLNKLWVFGRERKV